MGQHFVAHKTAVDVAVLVVGTRAGGVGQTCAAGDGDGTFAVRHGDRLLDEVFTQHIRQTTGQSILYFALAGHKTGTPLLNEFAFVPDGKTHVGPGQRVAAHRFHAVGEFGGVGFQEFAACRG